MTENKKVQPRVSVEELRQVHLLEKRKLNQLLERQQLINQLTIESENTLAATRELEKKSENESIIPIGAGVFVSAKITPQSYKRTLAANVVIPSTYSEVEKHLNERTEALAKEGEAIHKQIMETRTNLRGIVTLLKMARNARAKTKRP